MDLGSLAPELLASVVVHELQEVTSKVRIIFMYSLFYLIRIITRDLDQPFVSKLFIIGKSCISLKSVTFWEEYNCTK